MSLARDLELMDYMVRWKYGRQTPDTSLMRFVGRRFPWFAYMLDIGSGEGANARELRLRGYEVLTIDKDPSVDPDLCIDIRWWKPVVPGHLDLIYDVNTLCHVEDPPFERIKSWLKSDGIFFSICPTALAPKYVEEGKDYTRRVDELELRLMLEPFFSFVKIRYREEPGYRGEDDQLHSWIVEARQ